MIFFGFFFQVDESLELYKQKYDIVLVEDETLDVPNSLLRSILER